MRVVILTDDHPPRVGGVSAFVARFGSELVRRGAEVRVFARHRSGLEEVPGTMLRSVWGPSFGRWGGRWLALRGRRALLAADRVVATTWPVAEGLEGLPYDVIAHGSDVTVPPREPRVYDRVWRHATRRFALSRFLAGHVDATVLPAPVAVADTPRTGEGSDWVYVARATPLKGGDRFVRWVAAAGVCGHVVGAGPELARWRALAWTLRARVTFHGELCPMDVSRLVSRASLALLAPRARPDGAGAEGLGLVLLEAAGQGVPVVGCATGGVPEAVGPGLILREPDDAGASVEAIASFPHDGLKALQWVRTHHGCQRTVDVWNDG